jgi:hypothetical protein
MDWLMLIVPPVPVPFPLSVWKTPGSVGMNQGRINAAATAVLVIRRDIELCGLLTGPDSSPGTRAGPPRARPHRLSRSWPSALTSDRYPIAETQNASQLKPPGRRVAGIRYTASSGRPASTARR